MGEKTLPGLYTSPLSDGLAAEGRAYGDGRLRTLGVGILAPGGRVRLEAAPPSRPGRMNTAAYQRLVRRGQAKQLALVAARRAGLVWAGLP